MTELFKIGGRDRPITGRDLHFPAWLIFPNISVWQHQQRTALSRFTLTSVNAWQLILNSEIFITKHSTLRIPKKLMVYGLLHTTKWIIKENICCSLLLLLEKQQDYYIRKKFWLSVSVSALCRNSNESYTNI